MTSPVLSVNDLRVSFPSEAGTVSAVRGVSFDLHPGRTLGIVGESGSGKSVTSMSIMGLLPEYAKVEGSVKFAGRELLGLSDKEMSGVRGNGIGMIFQDPLSALTPVFDIGSQLVEAIQAHQDIGKKEALKQATELLDLVGIPEPHLRLKSFPHEFSGGMRQRVVIAIAIANNPRVLIADEPTTALDVTIQAQILDVIRLAQRETGAATIMITHDMGVVAETADDVMVMYAGQPVEHGDVDTIFSTPRMPYTVGLLGSTPRPDASASDPLTPIEGNPPVLVDLKDRCQFAPRCPVAQDDCLNSEPKLLPLEDENIFHRSACLRAPEIHNRKINGELMFKPPLLADDILANVPREDRKTTLAVKELRKQFPLTKGALIKRKVGTVKAIDGISFDIREGECLAIVGESGCGKTTTLLEIMDLGPDDGAVVLNGRNANDMNGSERREARKDIQIVFQDPMSSLNPRLTVREVIAEPLNSLGYDGDVDARVNELMGLVGLDSSQLDRFPSHFSGGQRQRIGLARALATRPSVLVLDEPVSALDVSIQAGVINLLEDLKRKLGLSYLFVAHDLSVVRHLSDRVAVMYKGKFVESGATDDIFDNPQDDYTKKLLDAIPNPDPTIARSRREKSRA
ncbi:oligopeptide ABC transporter ATP-binding protein OppD [Corynebacterium macginleyi]|uniref:ABC transporter ATP-binding protein n=1 Tax=Corynebacterium macginleyi TaxID=38290 RepID=A0ABS1Y3Y5_9CORY|nr:ABC transporter ATP-binding protein [Corynebacterium macginleyi]MBK4140671.1 oligopeptide ABC transporter ATP-binding protein OppD [Corynebacterium macginleyi]MBK4150478.1 oligopeptide ABC transporter ATP-binding protein OppD [Corynebacterium macginleyi]MBK4157424.1 oligopeptide ABC transporter ATP-binding protein OppD [Corynebacterium macginleyi]MBK4161815.1 oligopeptide ABC transporter ATP-binding protein OppD [Corynebacterium macginleyi]MBK4163529.1 oligopeptide ABC transporter ATP-bindi